MPRDVRGELGSSRVSSVSSFSIAFIVIQSKSPRSSCRARYLYELSELSLATFGTFAHGTPPSMDRPDTSERSRTSQSDTWRLVQIQRVVQNGLETCTEPASSCTTRVGESTLRHSVCLNHYGERQNLKKISLTSRSDGRRTRSCGWCSSSDTFSE